MDNQQIDVTSEGNGISQILSVIWNSAAIGGKATHYKIMRLSTRVRYYANPSRTPDRENCNGQPGIVVHHFSDLVESPDGVSTLILLWHEEQKSTPLPFPLGLEQAASFISDWLKQAAFGGQPDHDGSNGKGWRMFTESWGHVAGHHYAIVGVQPAWAMYGK